ncbi:class I SAM-dependent methyltransferase [Marinibacterium profundimaris]|uniref:MFS transporter n=1 Tax=Marinibacterium profundimaris TaxID=1679460 RepID=A0A225NI21_9RHOB|nr:class I SAM-dependent methyltransferase [Marinibacterium profundimaris]OWU73475.1 MFS transporter [Marinibacterium profundimaris]
MSARLSLVLENGDLVLPDEGQILLLHPTAGAELSALPRERVLAVQPMRPDHDALAARGFEMAVAVPEGERFAAVVVFLPRAKDLARALVAQAAGVCDGPLVVDGAKTDGIESLLKDLRKRAGVEGTLSKAHGKIAWTVAPDSEAFADWRETPGEADGFRTVPGVFSADGVDPASALLAGALPGKLGRHVVDLGAGWGFLAARVLQDAGVKRLDLVEADARALDCARANVTDLRARFYWADARSWMPDAVPDVVVMNPPFHTGRTADPELGRGFIAAAARMLSPGGRLFLVANRQLPYEADLSALFTTSEQIGGDGRFKILRAERPSRGRRG